MSTATDMNENTVAAAPAITLSPSAKRAWDIAQGVQAERDDDYSVEIVGARNDYNSRGRGTTMARRVLRKGAWHWVSQPTSRGRIRAADRKDCTEGYVFEGELVAEFILGGSPKPTDFYLVHNDRTPLIPLAFTKTRAGYRVTDAACKRTIDVSDPYCWK